MDNAFPLLAGLGAGVVEYVIHSRLAADATEIFRDLRNPAAALRWSGQVPEMSAGQHTRAIGLRQAVVATAACQPGTSTRRSTAATRPWRSWRG